LLSLTNLGELLNLCCGSFQTKASRAVIWGYPGPTADPTNGTNAKPQADLAEITINGFNNTDSYDLSNVQWHI
jgi:hypothetical protein